MWPKRRQRKNPPTPPPTDAGSLAEHLARVDRLAASQDYPEGKTPAAAVEPLLGRRVSEEEARHFLGAAGMIGFNTISNLDPSKPSELVRKYGKGVLTVLGGNVMFSDTPLDVPKFLTDFEAKPTSTQTKLFREPSLFILAEHVAQGYLTKVGRPLRIADVACSSGEETWSIASSLRGNGVDAHIDGFDISNREVAVAQAGGPYTSTIPTLRLDLGVEYGHPDRAQYVSYFQAGEDTYDVHPTNELRSMATFHHLDVTTEQLAPGYDVIACYNMLWHYPQETREQMLSNMLSGLQPGGIFMFEGPSGGIDSNSSDEYRRWAEDLGGFGLQPHPDIGAENDWATGSILLYNPANKLDE